MSFAESKTNQATQLVQLVEHCAKFHDQDRRALITLTNNDHRENWLIESENFRNWLGHRFYTETNQVPSKSAVGDAIGILKSIALHQGKQHKAFLRVGCSADQYALDLGDPTWSSVVISANGWQVQPQQPVIFRRSQTQRALPMPIPGGNLDALWKCINIPVEQRILVVTWLLDALRADTSFPILLLEGEQGSAKSTTQQLLKQVIDPAATLLRTAPKKLDDMFIAAGNDYVLSFNNLSYLNSEQQDALCNMATGGTFTTRTLFTNDQETVINVQRPVMLNGIAALVTQSDLLERCLYFELPTIADGQRNTEEAINQLFVREHGVILGALLDTFVGALAVLPTVSRAKLSRMADYNLLGRAVAVVWGEAEQYFDDRYRDNQRRAQIGGLEASPIYRPLMDLLDRKIDGFYGTFSDLLIQLQPLRQEMADNWPKNSKALANHLKRIAPALRKDGTHVMFQEQRQARGMSVLIERRN